MRTLNTDILLFILSCILGGIFPIMLFGADCYLKTNLEIQLHDSYFVLQPYEAAIVTIGLILFAVFLIRSILTRFRNKLSIALLVLGAMIMTLVVIEILQILATVDEKFNL